MIFPHVSSMGAERIDSVFACPDDFIFSNNILCDWNFSFFPKHLCRQHTDEKALHGCPQSCPAPIFGKKYFPISVWLWTQGCVGIHLFKGLISSGAVLCCRARNASTSLPVQHRWELSPSGEGCVGGYWEMWAKPWLLQGVPTWHQHWFWISRTNVVSWLL